jgi:Spy/CpxP family protein refolding chaperone
MKLSIKPMRWTLAVAVLAVAGAAALPVLAQPMGGMMQARGMHGGPGGGMPMMHMSERMLDAVKATPEQRTQIRQIMDGARKDMQAQQESRRALRDEAMRIFTQPNVDANAVEALRQKRLAQHDQASKRMTQAMLEASRVLSPEQRKQLADTMQTRRQMMERHMQERRALEAPKT